MKDTRQYAIRTAWLISAAALIALEIIPSSGIVHASSPSFLAYDWSAVDKALENEIANKTFPGAVAAVVMDKSIIYSRAIGNFTYDNQTPPYPLNGTSGTVPMRLDTLFDLASLTKVTMTTTATMYLDQHGYLDIHLPVYTYLGSAFANSGKDEITSLNLLLHNAGFPPDPEPNYWDAAFGCPETIKPFPQENYSCRDRIYAGLMQQTLVNPVGAVFIYSDLSMITMAYVIGQIARSNHLVEATDLDTACAAGPTALAPDSILECYYEAFIRKFVINHLVMSDSSFLPPQDKFFRVAPTWNDTTYRHIALQGRVSDGNAYALGGIAGHAGMFSHVVDLSKLVGVLVQPDAFSTWINAATIAKYSKVYNETQSTRALGWDTNILGGCGSLSPETFTHTGYTGTQICNDPIRKISTILLTNRCYPDDSDISKEKILYARINFGNAVSSVIKV